MAVLTVFFSMKGETIAPGMKIVNLDKGHTAVGAEIIQSAIGGDLFEIETVKTYIPDHMKMIYEAKEELEQGVRPELKRYPQSFDQYSTVFLCYPNWWNTLPMPVVTFLEHFNWSGKRIVPFNTSGGGGLGESVAAISKYAAAAQIGEALTVPGTQVEQEEEQIRSWARTQLAREEE